MAKLFGRLFGRDEASASRYGAGDASTERAPKAGGADAGEPRVQLWHRETPGQQYDAPGMPVPGAGGDYGAREASATGMPGGEGAAYETPAADAGGDPTLVYPGRAGVNYSASPFASRMGANRDADSSSHGRSDVSSAAASPFANPADANRAAAFPFAEHANGNQDASPSGERARGVHLRSPFARKGKHDLILDRYRPLRQAGSGGFATVWVAYDTRIQRTVAVKIIELTDAEQARAALPGANAVPAHELDEPVRGAHARGREASSESEARAQAASPGEPAPDDDHALTRHYETAAEAGAGERAQAEDWKQVLDAENGECAWAEAGAVAGGESVAALDGAAFGSSARTAVVNPADVPPWEELPASLGDASAPTSLLPPDARPIPASAAADPSNPSPPSERIPDAPLMTHLPGLDEARTAAMLDDPSIVTVYDFEVRDGRAYLIMEYVEGLTLAQLIRRHDEELTLPVIAAVIGGVARALSVAHACGVLHLDIKPDNVLINKKGQVKVTDFGLATLADASGQGEVGGGTVGYMPLEQLRGQPVDARTDEWSLAALAYELLAGENPFYARTLADAQEAIEEAELLLPSLCWDGLPEEADEAVFRGLAIPREARYEEAQDFADALLPYLGDAKKGMRRLKDLVNEEIGSDANGMGGAGSGSGAGGAAGAGTEPGAGSGRPGAHRERGESLLWWPSWSSGAASTPEDEARAGASAASNAAAGSSSGASLLWWPNSGTNDSSDAGSGSNRGSRHGGAARTSSCEPRPPLRERLDPARRRLAARLVGAAGTGLLALVTGSTLAAHLGSSSDAAPFIQVGALILGVLLGAATPRGGVGAGYLALGAAFIVSGAPVVGVVLIAATALWWWTVGREDAPSANGGLVAPLAGVCWVGPLAPLVAGLIERPAHALATTAFSLVVALALGACGSGGLFWWPAPDVCAAGLPPNVQTRVLGLLALPATWVLAASWLAAALVCAIIRNRPTRAFAVMGVLAALAVLVIGALVPSLVAGAPFPAMPLAGTLAAGALALLAAWLVNPDFFE